jgi:hypothetical protein
LYMHSSRQFSKKTQTRQKTNNYWSLLSYLAKEQEDKGVEHRSAGHLFSAVTDLQAPKWQNKKAAKWKRKLKNRSGILDKGCTSVAGATT